MAALVQTISQQSGTVPVLQTRPSSSSGTFSSPQSSASRIQTMSWSSFNAGNSGSYRAGHPVVAPYASQNAQNRQSWAPQLRPEHRTLSAPAPTSSSPRTPNIAAGSVPNPSSPFRAHISKDDSALPSRNPRSHQSVRPLSTVNLSSSTANSSLAKPSPNRYRRGNQRTEAATSSNSGPAPVPTVVIDDMSHTGLARPPLHSRVSSVDDSSHVERVQPDRYRRRSLGNMDVSSYSNLSLDLSTLTPAPVQSGSYDFISFENQRPGSSNSQHTSVGSVHSTHSSVSSAREATPDSTASRSKPEDKRLSKPSPLSQPASTEPESPKPTPQATPRKATPPTLDSPAARQLHDLKNKGPGKSRLRRAFSFGSASELLKSSTQSNAARREAYAAEQARREALREQLGPEQAAIAEQQELSGLGESIYSGQGNFFGGSNDNLSVSSTASSASMMLRKMGKGMKRSTRSLVGMFRPKSGASTSSMEGAAAEAPPQITVVNAEAERESVAVNPDPADLPRGATVFPKVEGQAAEIRRSTSIRERAASENLQSRKSIVGGDQERAEILAGLRKGILKKNQSDFGVSAPAHGLGNGASPYSSAPQTPDENASSPAPQTDSVNIAGEDYFLSNAGRFNSESKSAPLTPQAVGGRNIVFSPRIQFHDTWPSGEYDRRGEIATCNRLTPLLAQQIREEINNFKMEMEVHENSKIYTHFI